MLPNGTATSAAERLLVLTLALEQSAPQAEPAELEALFRERETVITELERLSLDPPALATLLKVQAVEARLLGNLCDWRTLIVKQFSDGRAVRKAATAYKRQTGETLCQMDDAH